MSRWLALGEPVVRVTVRLPRLKSKDERLRERAGAHVDAAFVLLYGEKDAWRHVTRKRIRVQIRLNERKAVLKRLKRIPRWRVFERRRALALVLWTYGIPKWW